MAMFVPDPVDRWIECLCIVHEKSIRRRREYVARLRKRIIKFKDAAVLLYKQEIDDLKKANTELVDTNTNLKLGYDVLKAKIKEKSSIIQNLLSDI